MHRGNRAATEPAGAVGHPPRRTRTDPTGDLARALHRSNGTVTEFLERLAGEPVDAHVLSQHARPAGPANPLGLDVGAELVRRTALLTGRSSGRRFVYAVSAIAVERLPAVVRWRLALSRDPIGRVLTEHRLEVRRVPRAQPDVPAGVLPWVLDLLDGAAFSRCYLMAVGGDPAIVVSEWFLRGTTEALATSTASRVGPDDAPGS